MNWLQSIDITIISQFFTTINYRRPSGVTVQDERFSLSASHPLAIISRPVHLYGLAVILFAHSLMKKRPNHKLSR